MKTSIGLIIIFSLLFAGCAAYKELEPEPQVSFFEDGYIELLDDEDKFELDEGKKYFTRFPQATGDNIYLVLTFKDKSPIISYLTRVFDDGEGSIIRMTDESDDPLTSSVFLLDKTVPMFYWVIEDVRQDFILDMTYRYVAVWRYKFEKKHSEFKQILTDNTQSRKILEEIGTSVSLNEVDYTGETASVVRMSGNIEAVRTQLHEIEEILPQEILNSNDQAYKDYLLLKDQIDEELAFQQSYKQTMELLEVISKPKPDIDKFVLLAPGYDALLSDQTVYSAKFFAAVNSGLGQTLPEVGPHYEAQLKKKKDSTPIDIDLQPVVALYPAAGIPDDETLLAMNDFITTYNQRANALLKVKEQVSALNKELNTASIWPTNQYYFDKRAELSRIKYNLPQSDKQAYGSYQSYACTSALTQSIRGQNNEINSLDKKFKRAENLVPQINVFRQQGNYNQILRLLKQNSDLTFLKIQYAELDELSMNQQRTAISNALADNSFQRAELDLRAFDQDQNFLNPGTIIPRKNKLVKAYEDSLYNRVKYVSISNANSLIEANLTTLENVDSLYSNPAMYPVYTFGFSRTPGGAAQKNQNLSAKMTALRTKTFPEKAIETLYQSFIDAMHQRGVEKARAIVVHGRNYTGDNKKFINLIAECDPTASKWVTKPKQYRKLYALPITNNIGGSNLYMAKINLQIPSEAKFPLYDVNVKLPQEVGRHAGNRQWYEIITFNKKVLKNEGRFTITAPDPDNDYIAQITPLQVNKTGNNVIEIRFNYDSFKVLEISVMAQKPIIKKN